MFKRKAYVEFSMMSQNFDVLEKTTDMNSAARSRPRKILDLTNF